jgi:hypothetical protein
MFFTKEIRANVPRPYGKGSLVPDTHDDITQLGVLDTSTRPGKDVTVADGLTQPDQIILQARIRGVPIENLQTMLVLRVNEKTLPSVAFYGEKILEPEQVLYAKVGQHAAVELVFTGYGYAKQKGNEIGLEAIGVLDVSKGSVFLRKEFLCQKRAHLKQLHEMQSDEKWRVTPAYGCGEGTDITPLMAYGGYVKKDVPLERISQVFGSVERSTKSRSHKLILRTQIELTKEGITPPVGGVFGGAKYVFCDSMNQNQCLSLVGMIEMGLAQIHLSAFGADSQNACNYVCWRYVQNDPATGCVDLYFRKNL